MAALFSQGIIDQQLATFWLNWLPDEQSFVNFGGVAEDSGEIAQASTGAPFKQQLVYKYDMWWTVAMSSVEYGSQNMKASDVSYAILDTGTSLLTIA